MAGDGAEGCGRGDQPTVGEGTALRELARAALAEAADDPYRATDLLLARLEINPALTGALTRASLREILADLVRACAADRPGRRGGTRP
jgi:hypothetical protein